MGLWDWLTGRSRRTGGAPPAPATTSHVLGSAPRAAPRPAFAVIDVETTGLSPRRDRVLELAIVRLDVGRLPKHVVEAYAEAVRT